MNRTYYNPETKIWSGPKKERSFDPNVSVGKSLLSALSAAPNKIAQICDNTGVQITFNEMRLRSIRVAQKLLSLNYQQGDVIGIIAKNTENLAPLVFGALICGTPINALDVTFKNDEVVHMFGTTKPKAVFCDRDNYEIVKSSLAVLKLASTIYLMDANGKQDNVGYLEEFLRETGTENNFVPPILHEGSKQTAMLMCSSGTTGPSKAVCLSHFLLLFKDGEIIRKNTDDIAFSFHTLYWMGGFAMLFYNTLKGNTRIITDKQFSAELFLEIIEKYKVSLTLAPVSQIGSILQCPDIKYRDLSSLKIFATSGSCVPVSFAESLNTYLKNGFLLNGYGMTELGGGCAHNFSKSHLDTVGRIYWGYEIKIIDDKGSNQKATKVGEICIRNEFMFSGYYGNPKATKEILDDEGWLHSGDLGYVYNEVYLHIVDRKKDVIRYKNYHIYPSDIETEILKLPGVEQVCVNGIPDLVATDLPAAAVVKSKNSNLTENDILNHIASNMSPHKQLSGGVYFVESIPMTSSGKIQRRKVRDLLIELYKDKYGSVPETL